MNSSSAFKDELEKIALLERLVRLGATDIPGTPRMLMKQRSPAQLSQLQNSVTVMRDKFVAHPLMNAATPILNKLPEGKIRNLATSATRQMAEDPIGMTAAHAIPVPGASLVYAAGKRALEYGIDRAFPLPR